MSENLNVDKFRNGDPIPEAKTDREWERAGANKQPAWCYYNNDPANGAKYGKMYNWYAVNDSLGLAPTGWHEGEWKTLYDYLDGKNVGGLKTKDTKGWNDNGNGNNESGFSGLPGGTRSSTYGFRMVGSYGGWWSSSEEYSNTAFIYFSTQYTDFFQRNTDGKGVGISVRCLRD